MVCGIEIVHQKHVFELSPKMGSRKLLLCNVIDTDRGDGHRLFGDIVIRRGRVHYHASRFQLRLDPLRTIYNDKVRFLFGIRIIAENALFDQAADRAFLPVKILYMRKKSFGIDLFQRFVQDIIKPLDQISFIINVFWHVFDLRFKTSS